MADIKYFVLLLLLLPIVHASSPKFAIEEVLNDSLINGDNDVGHLVFVEQPYASDTFNVSSFSSNAVQQYDIFHWKGNQSIRMVSPQLQEEVLVTNSQYYFQTTGYYEYIALTNSSIKGSVTVSAADLIEINIGRENLTDGFELDFSPDAFVLKDERTVNVFAVVDDDINPGPYDLNYQVNGKNYVLDLFVDENEEWEVDRNTLNETYELKSGDIKHLGYIILKNTGNVNLEVDVEKEGNNTFLISIPEVQTLYKKSTLRIDVQAQIPTIQKIGSNRIEIRVAAGDVQKVFNLTLNVIDSIKPRITQINFSTDRAFAPNKITVLAEDNIEVEKVTLEYRGDKRVMQKDNQMFTDDIIFEQLSRYVMTFCAYDTSNNERCEVINKTFEQVDVIAGYDKNIVMPSKKIGKYSQYHIFNLTEDVPSGVGIELVEFMANGRLANSSYFVRIVDGDNSVKRFDDFTSLVYVFNKGPVYLEVRSETVNDFSGSLSFVMPEYASQIQDLEFKVSFKDFDVPEDFSVEWLDGEIVCRVKDTGDLDTSYFECNGLQYPIDTKREDVAIPTTVEERETFRAEVVEAKKDVDNVKRKTRVYIALFAGIILMLLFVFYIIIYQYPYFRFGAKRGKDFDREVERGNK